MTYVKNNWIDNNNLFPVSANRLNHMEAGIEAANSFLILEQDELVPENTPVGTIIIRKEV